MKARIDKIFSRYYSMGVNKYVVYCRIKVGKEWRYERLFFPTEDEARNIEEGQVYEVRIRITYKDKHYDEYIDAASAENAKKKFCSGGKKVSNKILDYFGVKKKIDCEFSINPVNELI